MAKKDLGGIQRSPRSNKGIRSADGSAPAKVVGTKRDGARGDTAQDSSERSNPNTLQLGISILQHVEGQLNRADSKAQFTLTLDALLLASSALLGGGATGEVARLGARILAHRLVPIVGIAMFVALLISTIYALLAVMPRFTPRNMANKNIFYFGNIVQQNREDFAEYYVSQSPHEIEKMLMAEIHDLSGIAKQKFALIRISYIFLFFSLGFWSIVQTIILLTR